MASRTSHQAWSKGFRRRYIPYIVTAELRTVNVAYFQIKIQLSRFSAYPQGSPPELIRISGVPLYRRPKSRFPMYVTTRNNLAAAPFKNPFDRQHNKFLSPVHKPSSCTRTLSHWTPTLIHDGDQMATR